MILAHASDLHALRLDGVSPLSFLSHKRLAGAANLLVKRRNKHPLALFTALVDDLNRLAPDHVAITGDLSNLSLPSELRAARGELDRLALGPDGVTVVPGNHDVYTWSAARSHAFERAIGPYARSDGAKDGDGSSAIEFPIVRVRGEVAIVGVSTARPSPVPFADGRVGRAQLERLERALLLHRNKTRVVLLHHPPLRNRHAFLRGLRDRDALADVIARAGAELILHGHEHRDVRGALRGPAGEVPVFGVGSATYDDPRPDRRARYNVLRLDGRRVTVETRVHDPRQGCFTPLAA